jgi:hypothetical protein
VGLKNELTHSNFQCAWPLDRPDSRSSNAAA